MISSIYRPITMQPPQEKPTDRISDSEVVPSSGRLLVWIDRVGSYLICLNDSVGLGAVTGDQQQAEVSFMANLSRKHATIQRTGDSYRLTSQAPTLLNGRPVDVEAYLSSGTEISLGPVKVLFEQPTVLSASAVLKPHTSHRIDGGVDGVVLMENLCLLGPGTDHHILCRHWEAPIILFRRGEELYCKSPAALFVNEQLVQEEAPLSHGAVITGPEARFRIEYISSH